MTLIGSKYSYFSHSSSRYIKVLIEADVLSQDVATNSAQVVFRARITPDDININGNYMIISCSSATVDGQTVSVTQQAYSKRVNLLSGTTGYNEILNNAILWETAPVTITYNSNRTKTVSIKIAYGASAYSTKEVYNPAGYYEEQSTLLGSTSSTQTLSWALPELPTYAVITGIASEMTDAEDIYKVFSYVVPTGTTNVQIGALFSDGTEAISFVDVPNESGYFFFSFSDVSEEDKQRIWANTLDKGLSSVQITFNIKSFDPVANKEYIKAYSSPTKLTIVDYKPTIEPDIWDTNDVTKNLTGDESILVKYFSDVRYDAGAYAHKGATLSQILVTNGNNRLETFAGNIAGVINPEFTFRVWDSRGNTTEVITNLSPTKWIEYTKLTSSIKTTDMAADGDVKVTVSGKYFKGSFGAQNNTLNIVCTAVPTRGDTITKTINNVSPTMSDNNYTYEFDLTGLSYTDTYTVTVTATDKLMSVTSGSSVVAPEPIFDWGREDFNFNVPVNVNGEITAQSIKINGYTVPTIVEQGTTSSGWTYRKWSDGIAECWTTKTFTGVAVTNAWGSMYASGAISGSNLTFPTNLFVAVPTVNTSLATGSLGGILMAPGGTGSNTTSKTNTGILEIARGTSSTGAFTINYDVKGRWK